MDIAKLDKYVKARKQSVLTPYLDEIRYLVERGATQKSILAYLKNEEGIEVTQSYLSRFIKRYITAGDTTPKKEGVLQPVTEVSVDKPAEEMPDENTSPEDKTAENEEAKDPQGEGEDISKEDREKMIGDLIKRNQNALGKWG